MARETLLRNIPVLREVMYRNVSPAKIEVITPHPETTKQVIGKVTLASGKYAEMLIPTRTRRDNRGVLHVDPIMQEG